MLKSHCASAPLLRFCLMVSLALPTAWASAQSTPVADACQQLVLVVTPSYAATQGLLYQFEREKKTSPWKKRGAPVAIVLGRAGLGWGEGLHASIPAQKPRKREGDGRSPAGAFALSTAFGFATPAEMHGLNFPYVQITEALECVDDSASQYYNALVDRAKLAQSDWHSSEKMFAIKNDYRLGVFVEHNSKPSRRGHGSCIFLHIWSGPTEPTVGCTAMAGNDMEAIIQWLRREAAPVLVQLPQEEYELLRGPWQLPALH